jgi:hypothetical protein
LYGNFRHREEWVEPNPAFKGEIIVDADGNFYGYSKELYQSIWPESLDTRALYGYYGPNDHMGEGIAFYKLCSLPLQKPLLYVVEDLLGEVPGYWAYFQNEETEVKTSLGSGLMNSFGFERVDEADIRLEQAEYSDEAAERIMKAYLEIVKPDYIYGELLTGDTKDYPKLLIENYKGQQE